MSSRVGDGAVGHWGGEAKKRKIINDASCSDIIFLTDPLSSDSRRFRCDFIEIFCRTNETISGEHDLPLFHSGDPEMTDTSWARNQLSSRAKAGVDNRGKHTLRRDVRFNEADETTEAKKSGHFCLKRRLATAVLSLIYHYYHYYDGHDYYSRDFSLFFLFTLPWRSHRCAQRGQSGQPPSTLRWETKI